MHASLLLLHIRYLTPSPPGTNPFYHQRRPDAKICYPAKRRSMRILPNLSVRTMALLAK
jgi:hypothetical protein